MQAPMISVPLKATNEIDWIQPLQQYIRQTYGDDPERYAEECATLNRLRQDMRGAGKDSASGRDLLYRYYGQLELLDLRFPVDENHIKISFTWFDAFTQKPTSQYSLAYEKASIIFNISAVLSCHAANQPRYEDSGLKMAYHSFQASAGMFTYINENFLHAPSTDLSRDTVKVLTQIMLAQGQEIFLEKQIADGKKVGLLAKLASQAGYLYTQALEGTQENVNKNVFEKVWLLVVQIKSMYMTSLAQYYQALADNDANSHGIAISRLQVAEIVTKEASKLANCFPAIMPVNSNLTSESGSILLELNKRHLTNIHEKLSELIKENDYIYHQTVPAEAALAIIPKLPAAKAIPVSELYAGQDIKRITGPDIFQKIVPISVTESASLYDEEKAKLIRAETERVEIANGEMAASLDYLHLPSALQVIKGSFDQKLVVDDEFKTWCQDIASHSTSQPTFDQLKSCKESVVDSLDRNLQQLDLEESVCEKMRSKYQDKWTQQPSSRLTTTLRSDIKRYRDALEEASLSDDQLYSKFYQNKDDFDEMRIAGEMEEADVLFQKSLMQLQGDKFIKSSTGEASLLDEDFSNDGPSVADQINRVEDILKKLHLIKRERAQVLKDLKEKVHNDDISQVLILNKKSLSSFEAEIFQSELEKFKPHQSRLLSANHKQSSLMRELTSALNTLLQDKRVRAEQTKYELLSRQCSSIISKYKRIYKDFLDYEAGINSAKEWYRGMRDTVDSLGKNIENFVNNRRSEGAQLLSQIELEQNSSKSDQGMEDKRIQGLMEQMSINPLPLPLTSASNPISPSQSYSKDHHLITQQARSNDLYDATPQQARSNDSFSNPPNYKPQPQGNHVYSVLSNPAYQASISQNPETYGQHVQTSNVQNLSYGYIPPPPPPGPPPLFPQQTIPQFNNTALSHNYGQISRTQQGANDPWSGLDSWK